MRWGLTGTPGTGKTTVAESLSIAMPIIHLGEIIDREGFITGHDTERETAIVDIDAVASWIRTQPDTCLVESHLAQLLPIDRAIVLRCHPHTLSERLEQRYGDDARTRIMENVSSERYDVILSEAVERLGEDCVYEIDTTDMTVTSLGEEIEAIIAGKRTPQSGIVSFLEEP